MKPPLHITQHKRFVPNVTYPNFCYAKTSFMLETLCEIAPKTSEVMCKIDIGVLGGENESSNYVLDKIW